MKFFDVFKISTKPTKDVAIDLGTANTVVYVKGEGIQIDEPTYVALNIKTEEVEYIGEKAKEIIGRTAKHTEIVRPLKNGVISDYEITEKMLTEFLKMKPEVKKRILFTGIPERIFLHLELDILYGIEQGKGENLLKVFHSLWLITGLMI